MNSANRELRQLMRVYGVPFWRLAIRWGCSEVTAIRRFRQELPEDEKEKLRGIIRELAAESGQEA